MTRPGDSLEIEAESLERRMWSRLDLKAGGADFSPSGIEGRPLPEDIRTSLQHGIGKDLRHLRIFDGKTGDRMARAAGARALTIGDDLFFRKGEYLPARESGMRLLAHEAVHSVQQRSSGKMIARQILFGKTNYRFDTYQITEEDLKDPDIIFRLKALSFSHLIKYRDRVADPAVKSYIANLLLASPPSSFEIAMGVSLGKLPITMKTESGWTIKVLADTYTEDETIVPKGKAKTLIKLPKMLVRWTSRSGKAENIRVDKTFLIQTVYGSGTGRTSPSGYGRGTTEEDIKSERTTLAHHEGSHAMDLVDFLMKNPPPRFGGRGGMEISSAQEEGRKYRAALDDYIENALEYSSKITDCVGAESGLPICRQSP